MSHVTLVGDATDAPNLTTLPPPTPTVRPGRFELWRAATRMVAAHPLLGVGPDNFRLSYGRYAAIASADPRTHSNNMYLEMLAGGGLLVGAAFAWLLWRAGRSAAASMRVSAGSAATVGIVAATLAIAVHATVDSFLSFAPTYVLFSLTLGCAVACARGMETPRANRV
jgi:O-antigen ligase